MIIAPIMRGCVDPREKSVIVPGLSGFLKRAQDSISSDGDAALMSEPQPISGKLIYLGFHVVRSGVDTGGHRYCSRVFGAVEIRGIHESGMGPYLPCVRRKRPPLMGLYPPTTALWSSNQSAISQRVGVFSPCRVVSTPGSSVSFPVDERFRDVERSLDRGWDPKNPHEVELAQYANHGQSESRPVGVGFPHRAGKYHVWMDSDPGM